MPQVTVRIPRLLAQVTDGRERVTVEATTVRDAIDGLLSKFPQLRVHVFDEQGEVRRHVMLFHGEDHVRSEEELARPIEPGDVVTVLQAVSGGAQS